MDKEDYKLTHSFSESEKRHMDNILSTYDSDTLRKHTHNELLWRVTRGTLSDSEIDDKDIENSLMMAYYHN